MLTSITADPITDNSVYGIPQVEYTVDGESGNNFGDAVSLAAFKVATAIESSTSAYSDVVRGRQKKLDDLGFALASFNKAQAELSTDNKSTDKATIKDFNTVKNILDYYEVQIEGLSSSMERGNIQKAVTEVQYRIDSENTNLQQDMVSLQSFMSKRDNAYSTASKIVRKCNNAASGTIRNVVG
ncbi:MAG: hypothetical protein E7049_06445 [Lentisphaerae bacterium]|jgi:thioester reductase-like protein|nr:hypothetical protein [Lentisphaerota bacterium]